VVDLKTKETSRFGSRASTPTLTTATAEITEPNGAEVKVAPQRLRAAVRARYSSMWVPAYYHLNPAAPQRYRVTLKTAQR
jgi:hypothetical protein